MQNNFSRFQRPAQRLQVEIRERIDDNIVLQSGPVIPAHFERMLFPIGVYDTRYNRHADLD